ncbi:exocyst complex component EXO70B1-like [Trifolium pratense]|uniref:exocyst complex component EXO70B1-like n=1 Tax=Trifolium pratense TaxID=57577 RepID=UPI001E6979A7|nr:exocyst complex component EXO70B1-like [Trifolium pratense]
MMHILIQIWKWLMQPKLWRFVGFVSSIVGLLCYGLSSSFNYLFGDWNLLKIFLYSVFSLIISLIILFAKTWQHSTSLRFKAHAAFLVLTITSLYSFFFDKVMNGKPDAYSLLSCAAFAIMLLSLSRKTQCGFEVDLLYFFLGCLIVQLMKIKLQLFIVGAAFGYLIIILRSSFSSIDVVIYNEDLTSPQDENLVIIEVNSDSLQLTSTDIGSSMVEQLSNYVKALRQENSNIIEKLGDDSGFIMSDPDFMIKALPTETIDNLHKTAKLMVSAGFEKDFSDVYISCRKECLVESLTRLGFKKLNIEDIQMLSWMEIEDGLERWIKASKLALKILFPTERRLCDRVFFGFSSIADLSFMNVCMEFTLQLLNFADAIAIGSQSPERLFKVIDMFETMRDLIPEFECLFRDQYSLSLQNEATTIWKKLGEAIRGIFMKLDNLIRRDRAKAAVPGGGLHPITRYVMNYLRAACRSRQTLEQVFEDYGHPLKEYPKIDDRMSSSSSLSVQMDWIMQLLESNLEAKSKIYKDPALCYVFLMNNCRYIVQKAEDSELGSLLGDDWIKKHTAKIRQYHVQYQIRSWNKVFGFLKVKYNGLIPPKGVAKSMKKKLKSFNMVFDDLCRVQSSWFIFDKQLREEIRISIEKLLLPAYENFMARFHNIAEVGKHAEKYIKYETEEIEARLNDLFQGSSGSTGSRKRS